MDETLVEIEDDGNISQSQNVEETDDFDFGKKPNKNEVDKNNEDTNDNNDDSSINNIDTGISEEQKENINNPDNNTNEEQDETFNINDYKEGDLVEIDGVQYTFDKDKNLIDDKGEIFKKAEELNNLFNNVEEVDENEISITNIINQFGEITDESGKNISFDNSLEGVKSYIEQIIDSKAKELSDDKINKIFDTYPVMEQVLNYLVANGGNFEGFNQVTDRSNISISKEDEAQQEAIIREAFKEKGIKGSVDAYIQYLKSSGILYDTAIEELNSLVESDKNKIIEQERKAKQAAEEEEKQIKEYWAKVKNIIDSKNINGFKISDNFTAVINGKRVPSNIEEFYKFISVPDKQGLTAYEKHLQERYKDGDKEIQDILLKAYLEFTGFDYSTLIKSEVNKKIIKSFRTNSKNVSERKPNIPKEKTNKGILDDYDF